MKLQAFTSTLALLLLTSALAACSDGAAEAVTDTAAADSTAGTADPAVTEPVREMHNVPVEELDFGGEEFFVLTYDGHNNRYYFFADAQTGDVMNDAIYERRRNVEETLNVSLKHELTADLAALSGTAKTAIIAGEDAYDQIMLHCIDGVSAFASSGYLYNLDALPYLDLDADWWNKEQMDVLRLGQNTYYAVNDYMIPYPFIIYFNREMVDNFDLADPYQHVLDGTWTIDIFAEMARTVVADLNGDSVIDWQNDRIGISATDTSKYISFLPASDQFITDRDSDGRIRLAMNTEKTQRVIEIFHSLGTENVCYLPPTGNDADQLSMRTGRILFYMNGPDELEKLRDCEVDFGFVPYPKWDAAQETYQSMDFGGLMCVPTTITNPELVGAVNELLAWDSGNNVVPTYYDILLQGKFAQDETAMQMLEIIFDSICYEVGGNYFGFSGGFNNLFYAVSNVAFQNKSTDFASFYAKNEKSAIKTIETFYEALDEVESQ
ncbi:MAG: carbohydrate ABC transporter substrate-binding protein [Clostridia bacterium]|nr:carbohydrate ABC transporter substrate-binding protein [Clostridia bacterium]